MGIIFLSGEKKGFLFIIFESHFNPSILSDPICITALSILIFLYFEFCIKISDMAPAATLIAVSLALDLPPPL